MSTQQQFIDFQGNLELYRKRYNKAGINNQQFAVIFGKQGGNLDDILTGLHNFIKQYEREGNQDVRDDLLLKIGGNDPAFQPIADAVAYRKRLKTDTATEQRRPRPVQGGQKFISQQLGGSGPDQDRPFLGG